jgi:hypothetical protein
MVVPAGNAPASSGYQPGALLLSYMTEIGSSDGALANPLRKVQRARADALPPRSWIVCRFQNRYNRVRIESGTMKTTWSPGVVLALAALGYTASALEPSYGEKPASFWLDSWHTNTDGASAAFKAMGTNAVPFLIKTLERNLQTRRICR